MYTVQYAYSLQYRYIPNHSELYPAVDIQLSTKGGSADILAVVDTGATRSLVTGEFAQVLGLELMQGVRVNLHSLRGSISTWGHSVTVKLFDLEFTLELCFSENTLHRNILGRDILDRLQVGFREHHSELFVLPSS